MQTRRKKGIEQKRDIQKLQKMFRQERRVLDRMKERNERLREIGKKILAGEDVTADNDKA